MPAATSKVPIPQAKEKIGSYSVSAGRSVNDHTPPPAARPKQRNSILVAASDALSFSLRRSKRATIQRTNTQKQRPSVVDEVLEISAEAAQKDELAERERLRDAAAQAVGLGGATSSESTMAANTMDDVSVMSSSARSAKRTTVISIHQPLSQANQNMSALPPYPATLNSLQPFIQHSSLLLKYYPSQSAFLKLQKSRQWKLRHLVLTSFRCPSESDSSAGTGDNATQAQLHLFKSSNGEEKEIERLGINQDSVIYVADGGFGGNKEFVVKVAGFQRGEGAPASSNNPPSSAAATVWLLQLPDLAQMQRWIQFIKSSVLTQRAEKAGLGPHFYNNTYGGSGPELKGDLDLMISMGKQGLLPGTPQLSTFEGGTLASRDKTERDSNTSVRSKQSTVANASSSSNSAVSALKGLFNGRPISRQLSSSRTSIGPSNQSLPLGATAQPPMQPQLQPQPQPQPQPQDGEAGAIVQSAEEPIRHDTFMRTFRPTSPPAAVGHPATLSPPLSPSHSLVTEESTSLNPVSPSLGSHPPISGARHYLPGSSATSSRKLAHSNSFSIDWDAIDGSYSTHMSGTNEKRISAASMALTPPPRNRRPWTTSTIPSPGSGGKIDWSAKDREKLSSAGTPVINLDLTSPIETDGHPLDAQGSPRIEPVREGSTAEEASLRETIGDDDTTTKLQDDAVRANGFSSPIIPHIPSPIVTPAPLLHSSSSSFAGGASNHNQSNRHSIHSVRNSILSDRSPRPPSRASIASYDTDAQHPPSVQHAIREVSESDPSPSAEHAPSPISLDHQQARDVEQTHTKETTERPNSFGFDPPSDLEKVKPGRLRLGTLLKQTPPPVGPPPAAPTLGISSSSLRCPSPTPENAISHQSHDRPPTPTSLNSTVPSVGDSLTGRHPQPPSLNGHALPHSKRISTISSTSARSGWSATSGSSNMEQPKGSFGVPTGGHTAPRALKVSTGSMSSQGPGSSLVHGNGNRTSILPPQRPIPSAALPSPPIGEVPDRRQSFLSNRSIAFSTTDSTSGSPSRPEFTFRSSRMSMAPPAPPPQGALPPRPDEVSRLSMSSFGSGTGLLHPIPASPSTGTASLLHGIVPPPTTSPPMRPLPPTPEVLRERPRSPTLSVDSTHSAHSNRSVGTLAKLPSLRFRLRMMNSSSSTPSAAPLGREVALSETRRSQQLSRLPPAPPPPTSAPPSIPSLPSTPGYRGHDRVISDVSYSSTVPPSPIGEAITSRLEQYPLSSILPMTSSHAQSYPSRRTSQQHVSYVRPLPQFPSQQPPTYERHSLSPPPRRNSRASQYPPPSEKDRERTDSLTRRQRPVPEESALGVRVVQMKHSAINLAGEGGGPFSSNL